MMVKFLVKGLPITFRIKSEGSFKHQSFLSYRIAIMSSLYRPTLRTLGLFIVSKCKNVLTIFLCSVFCYLLLLS